MDTFTASVIFSANPQTAESYNGNAVLTDSRMKMFAWWFESQISKNPQIENYNSKENSILEDI